jgi:alkylated DNA repair dioxygenase AlkB
VQPSLFDDDREPAVDPTFAGAHRTWLDEHSWVEHVPGWLTGSARLLEELLAATAWEHRERWMYGERVHEPRLTADHRDLATVPHPMLRTVVDALSAHYRVDFDGLWLNLYRDQRDSTGWHGDATTCRRPECVVPVLSLGATRRFLVRPAAGGTSTAWRPDSGDLLVMGGRCQRDWRHSVPKQAAPAGPRISVNVSASSQARRT